MKWINLNSINLSDNLIGPIGCKVLSEYISKHLSYISTMNSELDRELDMELDREFQLQLKCLNLSNNQLVGVAISQSNVIGRLDLEGIEQLLQVLASCSSILNVDLSRNYLGGVDYSSSGDYLSIYSSMYRYYYLSVTLCICNTIYL
jgi:Ran GTPase-activating protein (RanGAP) involved in mRNA processing and transport